MTRPAALDGLPLELIQRILIYGNCESALALSAVNRTLRLACKNTFVYQRLISHGNATLPSHVRSDPNEQKLLNLAVTPWVPPGVDVTSPTSEWAQWALADSEAMQLVPNLLRKLGATLRLWVLTDNHSIPETLLFRHLHKSFPAMSRSEMRGLLHLIMAQHPIVHVAPPELFAATIQSLDDVVQTIHAGMPLNHTGSFIKASLCLAAVLLCAGVPGRCLEPDQDPMQAITVVLALGLFETKWDYALSLENNPPSGNRRFHKGLHARALVLTAVSAMTVAIYYESFDRLSKPQVVLPPHFEAWDDLDSRAYPRPPSAIPLRDLMAIPPPFVPWKEAAEAYFPTWHLATMTDPAFLRDGPWVGYVFQHTNGGASPEVQRIDFHDTMEFPCKGKARNGARKDKIQLAGLGQVPGDLFGVAGFLDRATGWAAWRRDHTCGFPCGRAWDYVGWMTPFGLAGVWGQGRWGQDSCGWFWFWKQAWSEPWSEK